MNKTETIITPLTADPRGCAGAAIQRAIDAMAAAGGGTVRLAPGAFVLEDAVRLRPDVLLAGSGPDTVLCRGPLIWGALAEDADKSEKHFVPVDSTRWRPGMGVCMYDRHTGWAYGNDPRTLSAIDSRGCRLTDWLYENIRAEYGGYFVNHFPLVLIKDAAGAGVADLTLDAAVADPGGILTGLRCDALYVWRSPGVFLRGLTIRHALSDGLCFSGASVHMRIEDCDVGFCARHGIHPGSHSADCQIRGCRIHDCGSDGLYICWGIRRGLIIGNEIAHNGLTAYRSGICIGHKDTDCRIEDNQIRDNQKFGIAFRRKTAANGAHRAVLRGNVIENNGSPPGELAAIKAGLPAYEHVGCGIHVEGITHDLIIERNVIRETRQDPHRHQRHALVLESGVTVARLADNTLEGHPGEPILDRRGQPCPQTD